MFNIGDIVEVIEGAPYTYSTPGSFGKVVSVGETFIEVDFIYTPTGQKDIWDIRRKHLKLRETPSKEELVIKKIKQMYTRQQERGVVHV